MNKLETELEMEVEVGMKCCTCGKKYNNIEESYQMSVYKKVSNISISGIYLNYDVCSLQCYLKQVKKSINEIEKSGTGEIDGMDIAFAKKLLFFYGIE
jgi:hypothetical protein